jgi:putative endonuclease
MPYTVYILKCADKTLYIGFTNNLAKRLYTHNNLKSGAKYTKARRPVKLIYKEQFRNKIKAMKREYELKQLTRQEKLALIKNNK